MLESQLYREAIAAAEALHARKLWREFEKSDSFAVVVPGEEHPLVAAIMGQAGEEYGLALFRGPRALGELLDMLDRDLLDTDVSDDTAFLGFSMGRYDQTPPPGRRVLAKARYTGKGSSIVPGFLALDAGRGARALRSRASIGLLGDPVLCFRTLRVRARAPTPCVRGRELPSRNARAIACLRT
jgi:hypothetical protein